MINYLATNPIPLPIIRAYGIASNCIIKKIEGGHVNQTYLVISKGVKYLLQQLGEVLGNPTLDCHSSLCGHLIRQGWEVPDLVERGSAKSRTVRYSGHVWRCLKFIDSDNLVKPSIDAELFSACGGLLGKWHKDVAGLDLSPSAPEKEQHDVTREAQVLELSLKRLPREARDLANKILSDVSGLQKHPETAQQIIHGDPKLDNILFRGGKPFTLVDFDAVTIGSVWTDIGDMLRSLAGKKLSNHNLKIELVDIECFVQEYKKSAGQRGSISAEDFKSALNATREISLEVAMRYLNDLNDHSNYLSWDSDKYSSKLDNHISRAKLQFDVSTQLSRLQSQI